jgi:cytidine deaminase
MSKDRSTELHKAAVEIRARAYAPYSKFAVGAALLGADGQIYLGANVENASYPQGQCAEASAIGVMVAAGCTEIKAVMVVAETKGHDIVAPCGGCRQRLNEFAAPEVIIYLADPQTIRACVTMGELLPYSFGPKQLMP